MPSYKHPIATIAPIIIPTTIHGEGSGAEAEVGDAVGVEFVGT